MLDAPPAGVYGYVADLAEPDAPAKVMFDVCRDLGVPTVLVNAAGVYRAIDLLETDVAYADEVYAVNVRAPMLLIKELIARHAPAGTAARVVNVASVSGQIGSPDAAYGASKGALIALTRSLGRAFAGAGIRVNAVAPGIVDTDMARRIPADRLASYLGEIPLGRMASAREVADAVLFLLSDQASYLIGTVVDVNGGMA